MWIVTAGSLCFFCSFVCLFIGELWDCDWSWKRRSPWAWKVTDPNQQGLLSVMLESFHEWVESSFLSSLVRIGFFSFHFFFFSSIDNLCFYVQCDSRAALKIQGRKSVSEIGRLLQLNFGSMKLSRRSFLCIEIGYSNRESCQGPLTSTDLWLSFPSLSDLLYLLPLQFGTNVDCVFAQYVVEAICEATQVESRDVSDDAMVGWRSKEHAFEEGHFLQSSVKELKGKKKKTKKQKTPKITLQFSTLVN